MACCARLPARNRSYMPERDDGNGKRGNAKARDRLCQEKSVSPRRPPDFSDRVPHAVSAVGFQAISMRDALYTNSIRATLQRSLSAGGLEGTRLPLMFPS